VQTGTGVASPQLAAACVPATEAFPVSSVASLTGHGAAVAAMPAVSVVNDLGSTVASGGVAASMIFASGSDVQTGPAASMSAVANAGGASTRPGSLPTAVGCAFAGFAASSTCNATPASSKLPGTLANGTRTSPTVPTSGGDVAASIATGGRPGTAAVAAAGGTVCTTSLGTVAGAAGSGMSGSTQQPGAAADVQLSSSHPQPSHQAVASNAACSPGMHVAGVAATESAPAPAREALAAGAAAVALGSGVAVAGTQVDGSVAASMAGSASGQPNTATTTGAPAASASVTPRPASASMSAVTVGVVAGTVPATSAALAVGSQGELSSEPSASPSSGATTQHYYIGDEPKEQVASQSGTPAGASSAPAALSQGLLVPPLPVPAGKGQGTPMTFGRFTVTAAPSSPERSLEGKTPPLPDPGRIGVSAANETGTGNASEDASSELAGPSSALPPAAGPSVSPRPSEGSSSRVQRLGRFTVFPVNSAAGVNDDETTDLDSSTTPDSASLCAERPDNFGVHLQDVHAFLELKHNEMGVLFDKMRAQIFQVMVGQVTGSAGAAPSPPGQQMVAGPAMNAAPPAAVPTPTTAAQHVQPGPLAQLAAPLARAGAGRPGCSPTTAAPGIASGRGVRTGPIDEAINLWEALGKPIERATKRNRVLEEENKRLKREIALKERELRELQRRTQARDAALGSLSTAPIGRSTSETSTGTSTPTAGSSVGTGVPVAARVAQAPGSLASAGPPAPVNATGTAPAVSDAAPAVAAPSVPVFGTATVCVGQGTHANSHSAAAQVPVTWQDHAHSATAPFPAPLLASASTPAAAAASVAPIPQGINDTPVHGIAGSSAVCSTSPRTTPSPVSSAAAVPNIPVDSGASSGAPAVVQPSIVSPSVSAARATANSAATASTMPCPPAAHAVRPETADAAAQQAPSISVPAAAAAGASAVTQAGVAASMGVAAPGPTAVSSTAVATGDTLLSSVAPAAASRTSFSSTSRPSGVALGTARQPAAAAAAAAASASSGCGPHAGASPGLTGPQASPAAASAPVSMVPSHATAVGGDGTPRGAAVAPSASGTPGSAPLSASPKSAATRASPGCPARQVTGSPPRRSVEAPVPAEAALEGALRQAASSLVAKTAATSAPPASWVGAVGSGGSVGIQQSNQVSLSHLLLDSEQTQRIHHSHSLPHLTHQLSQGMDRHGKMEGCSPDVQGYGPPATYRSWRKHGIASTGRGERPLGSDSGVGCSPGQPR